MSRLHISDSSAGRRHALLQTLLHLACESLVATDMSEVWADFARQARQLISCKHGLAEDGFATFSAWREAVGSLRPVAEISVDRGSLMSRTDRTRRAGVRLVLATVASKSSPSSEL